MQIKDIFDKAKCSHTPLILDGAMGSLLEQQFPSYLIDGCWMN